MGEADVSDLIDRLTSLRQYQESGRRSPHKPLLVLLALGHLVNTGSSLMQWQDVDERLGFLLQEFGPPRRGGPKPEYPFTRLRADMVWQLSRDVPDDQVRPLNQEPISGQFVPDLESRLVSDPSAPYKVARGIVEQQFPMTIASDVLIATGLDPELVFSEGLDASVSVSERRRSSSWPREILQAWDGSCAFCGFDGQLGGASVAVEAAHVRWFKFEGPDELDNGMALCSLHHKLFDRGVLGLRDPETVMVSEAFSARTDEGRRIYDLHGKRLSPRPGTALPAAGNIRWHLEEVFKAEALSA